MTGTKKMMPAQPALTIIDKLLNDRGSKYAVSGGPAASREEVTALLAELRRNKRFAKATHNSWAVWLGEEAVKDDDGEAGAGAIILAELENAGLRNNVVIVTRWYGGKHLGGDRFRHVRTAVRAWLEGQGRKPATR